MFWKVLAVLFGFVAVGVWLTPLRFVTSLANLEASGLTASQYSGTIWNGRIDDLSLRGASLGDFNVRTRPLSLLTGSPTLVFRSNGPIVEGAIRSSSSGMEFEGLRGQVALTQLDQRAPSGALATFLDADLALSPTSCRSASGQARIVGMAAAGLPDMSGPISCENGQIRLALSPDGNQPGVPIDILIDISDQADPQLLARTDDPAAQMALPAYGIEIASP